MFTEVDRVQIRQYLGYSGLWLQLDPRLESAISNIQSVADGGTRPTSDTENLVRSYVDKLQDIDDSLDGLDDYQATEEADGNKFDVVKEDNRLRRKGRMYVHRLAKALDTKPRADIYASTDASDDFRASAAFLPAGNNRTAY